MQPLNAPLVRKTALDKDLKKIAKFEAAAHANVIPTIKIGLGLLFLLAVFGITAASFGFGPEGRLIIAAAVFGGYMALNIGANDVTNNVGPAVGSKALTLTGALIIAAICETAGALLAGGDVVGTISKGIISPDVFTSTASFVAVMLAALLASAIWVNLATYLGAPVSTTHAVVGGVLGSGIAASSWSAVNWPVMTQIIASWVISPVLGGAIAAAILLFIKIVIIRRHNRVMAAQRWVPILVGLMSGCFTVYLIQKGLNHIWKPSLLLVCLLGGLAFLLAFSIMRRNIKKLPFDYPNTRKAVARLFVVPLIASAGLLSFAHGANDVANAIGPLSAIVSAVHEGTINSEVKIPLWVMLVGALGISAGLGLFGPRLIRMVGEQITKLDPIRAFAVALSAAFTVIVASGMGLPVSSTHIAVGGVFGVGFLREYLSGTRTVVSPNLAPSVIERKILKLQRRRLVRRRHLIGIGAAWVVTVPLAALLAAGIYLVLNLYIKL